MNPSISSDPLGNLTLEEVMGDERSRMQGIIVLKNGKIVYEKYVGMPQNANHTWMSSTKVVTGLIIHMLEQEGSLFIRIPAGRRRLFQNGRLRPGGRVQLFSNIPGRKSFPAVFTNVFIQTRSR